MITHTKILSGGILFILLSSATLAQAQRYIVNYEQEDGQIYSRTIDTQNNSQQGYAPQNYMPRNYAPQGYAPPSHASDNYMPRAAQQPMRQGKYYIQNYLPKTQMLPTTKPQSPAELLKISINKVIYYLAQPKDNVSVQQTTAFLQHEIAPHFDFEYMARWVAGRYSKTMTPEQQREFTNNFSELFIATFVKKISNYRKYPPVVDSYKSKRSSETEAVVTANVIQESGVELKIEFKFLKGKKGWKVIDVRGNGISALFYYRNHFAQQMRQRKQQQAIFN